MTVRSGRSIPQRVPQRPAFNRICWISIYCYHMPPLPITAARATPVTIVCPSPHLRTHRPICCALGICVQAKPEALRFPCTQPSAWRLRKILLGTVIDMPRHRVPDLQRANCRLGSTFVGTREPLRVAAHSIVRRTPLRCSFFFAKPTPCDMSRGIILARCSETNRSPPGAYIVARCAAMPPFAAPSLR